MDDTCIICLDPIDIEIESNILCNNCKCLICSECNHKYRYTYNYQECPKCRRFLSIVIVNDDNQTTQQLNHNRYNYNGFILGLGLVTFGVISYYTGVAITSYDNIDFIVLNLFIGVCINGFILSLCLSFLNNFD